MTNYDINKSTSSYSPYLTGVISNNTSTIYEGDLLGSLDPSNIGVNPSNLISCEFCGLTFVDYGIFNLHLSNFHPQNYEFEITERNGVNLFIDHQSCESTSAASSPASFKSANSTALSDYSVSSISDMLDFYPSDRIVQLDGAHDISLMSGQSHHNVYLADYALNQEKQLRKIRDDASIPDMDLIVNNNDQNCLIKCSSGFYIAVVRPCFSPFEKHFVMSCYDIAITVTEVSSTYDKNGLEANRKVKFSFMSHFDNLGGVFVHLHHSNRTVQVQGSSTMPDSSKAAVWFTNKCLIKRFNDLAIVKQFEIQTYNQNLQKTLSTPPEVSDSPNFCRSCNKIFNANSKPSVCPTCNNYFHKTCLIDHVKCCVYPVTQQIQFSCSPPNPSDTTPAGPHQSLLPSIPTNNKNSNVSNAHPRPTVVSLLSMIEDVGTKQSPSNITVPTPNNAMPSGADAENQIQPSLSCPNQVPPHRPPSQRKKAPKHVQSSQDHNIAFLTRELTAAQARIVDLDAEISDKKKRIEILQARIKNFEE